MSIEFDADSDFPSFEAYIDSQLKPAIEAEVLACMKDGAARARAAPFHDQSGDTRKSIEGGVGGTLRGDRATMDIGNGEIATEEKIVEGYIRAESDGAIFLEKGTVAHEIVPRGRRTKGQEGAKTRRGRRMLRFTGSGGDIVFARKVKHPGTKALHFIENSMSEDEFSRRVEGKFEKVLDNYRK